MKEKFESLQVLRGLAAALVAFSHALSNWAEKGLPEGAAPHLPRLGEYGVYLFFCISGFIIVHTSREMPRGWDGALSFMRRRCARVVPLYWLVTSLFLAKLALAGRYSTPGEVARSYGFILNVTDDTWVQPILGQGWSLNYEMFFYVVFASLFVLPRRSHAIGAASLLTGLAAARAAGWLDVIAGTALFHWVDAIVLYFVLGIVASLLSDAWSGPVLPGGWGAGLASAMVIGFAVLALPQGGPALLAMPVACIVPVLACVTSRPGACPRPWRPFVLAGDASYSSYLTHGFVLALLAHLLRAVHWPIGFLPFAFAATVLSAVVGYGVYVLVERPLSAAPYARLLARLLAPLVRAASITRSHSPRGDA
jgi:peptidoglycan/LPS O-acetylase OafA/YrhL